MRTCTKCGRKKKADKFYGNRGTCKSCLYRQKQLRRATSRTKALMRARRLKRRYGLTVAEFNGMVTQQGGKCMVCRKRPRGILHIDHDHETGKVRGLLCTSCNQGLGYFKDNPVYLVRAAKYLLRDV